MLEPSKGRSGISIWRRCSKAGLNTGWWKFRSATEGDMVRILKILKRTDFLQMKLLKRTAGRNIWCICSASCPAFRISEDLMKNCIRRGLRHRGYGSPPARSASEGNRPARSEEHTSELQSRGLLVCGLLLDKKNCRREPTMAPS